MIAKKVWQTFNWVNCCTAVLFILEGNFYASFVMSSLCCEGRGLIKEKITNTKEERLEFSDLDLLFSLAEN